MVSCGLRVSEVSRLNESDLIRSGKQYLLAVHGKGRDGKSDHIVIDNRIARMTLDFIGRGTKARRRNRPIFRSEAIRNHNGRLSPRTISRIIKEAMVEAGYDSPRLTAHSLRHSAITYALKAGATLQEVQQFARHARIDTT